MKTILILSLFLTNTAFAFTLNSSSNPNLKGWANTDVKIYLNPANCPAGLDVVSIIKDAVAVWNNMPSSTLKVSYGGATTGTTMSNPPTAYCETNFQAVVGDQDSIPGAGAVNGASGQITGGLLYLNASAGQANIANLNRNVLTIVMAHEIGHILGLGHSSDLNALMYYDGSYKQHLNLAQDDIDGMTYLYPQDSLTANSLVGCGLIKTLKPRPPSGSESLMLMMLFFLPVAVALVLRSKTLKI